MQGDTGVSTNPLENFNLKLKSKISTQKSAFKKPKAFEEDAICLYTSNVAKFAMKIIKCRKLRQKP